MMSKTMSAAAALAAVTTAKFSPHDLPEITRLLLSYQPQVEYRPEVGDTNFNIFESAGVWARIDFIMGVFIGAYDILQQEAYDYNCYSMVFSFFMNLPDVTKYYDTGVTDDLKLLFWAEILGQAFEGFAALTTC